MQVFHGSDIRIETNSDALLWKNTWQINYEILIKELNQK